MSVGFIKTKGNGIISLFCAFLLTCTGYINTDDAIAFCLYLTNKMRGKTSLQWPPLYKGHYNGTRCCLIKLPFWWPHVSRLAAQESFTHSPIYTGLGEWVKLMSQTDFMCAMMSIVSSMVRNELSQPFLCILIDVHRNILMPMMPLPFVFITWIKGGGKPLCNGHLFPSLSSVPQVADCEEFQLYLHSSYCRQL